MAFVGVEGAEESAPFGIDHNMHRVLCILQAHPGLTVQGIQEQFYEKYESYGPPCFKLAIGLACWSLYVAGLIVAERDDMGNMRLFPPMIPDCEERTIGEMAQAYQRLLEQIPQEGTIEVDLPDF